MDNNNLANSDTKSWGRVSITPSGFFGSDPKHIVEIVDFMTEEELTTLNDFIRNNKNLGYYRIPL